MRAFQLDPKLTIIVPDFSLNTVKNFLQLIYTGSVFIDSLDELVNFQVIHSLLRQPNAFVTAY